MPTYRQSIASDIEGRADYIPPDLYRVLSFHQSLELDGDELSSGYLPLHGAKPNPKLFVIGIIPPNLQISGRLLDRSATVAAKEQIPTSIVDATTGIPGASTPATAGTATPDPRPVAKSNSNALSDDAQPGVGGANLPQSFWVAYVEMCNRLGVDPLALATVLNNESGFKPGAQNFDGGNGKRTNEAVAKGLNQIIKPIGIGKLGMTPEEWASYQNLSAEEQLFWVEKYFKKTGCKGASAGAIYRKNFGGYPNPDGSLYASYAHQEFYTSVSGKPFPNPKNNDLSYRSNLGLDKDKKGYIDQADLDRAVAGGPPPGIASQIDAAKAIVGNSKGTSPEGASARTNQTDKWAKTGSGASSEAKRLFSKSANKDLNFSALGLDLQARQAAYIRELANGVETMKNTPPLRFLVNPSSFKVSSEKIISDGTGGRYGPIVEHWGDGQDKIDMSGKLAAFMVGDPGGNSFGGLNRSARNFSASFQNFLSLYLIYRNNGALYMESGVQGQPKTFAAVGSVYIYYDGTLYIGSFDTFSFTESEEQPYTLEYNGAFTVRSTFLLDSQVNETLTLGGVLPRNPKLLPTNPNPLQPALATVYNLAPPEQVQAEIRAQAARDSGLSPQKPGLGLDAAIKADLARRNRNGTQPLHRNLSA